METQSSSSSSSSSDEYLTCTTFDQLEVKLPINVAKLSKTLNDMMGDCTNHTVVPLMEESCTEDTLKDIITWGEYHLAHPVTKPTTSANEKVKPFREDKTIIEIEPWDKTFMGDNVERIVRIFTAANFLDIDDLTQLCAKTCALMIKGKTPQQIRDLFGIENDLTPEEEEQIRRENAWCEEH